MPLPRAPGAPLNRHRDVGDSWPWRATLRTTIQAGVGLAAIAPGIVSASGVPQTVPWVAAALAICAGTTRVMNAPPVEAWLQRYVPWLAARPSSVTVVDTQISATPTE